MEVQCTNPCMARHFSLVQHGKQSGRGLKLKHLPSTNAEVKNEWSYISTPPLRRHSADRSSFTKDETSIG